MVSVSPMGSPVTTSGAILLVTVKIVLNTQWEIVHVLSDQDPVHHHLLGIITTVNQQILTHLSHRYSIQTIDSGMASSVKVPAVVVPSLPHGSVYGHTTDEIEVRICAE